MSYLICFSIAPYNYVHEKLINNNWESSCFVVSFDESLNQVGNEEQMNIVILFIQGNRVLLRYLHSQFHKTAADLVNTFKEGTWGLNQGNMLQISMDGPATNLGPEPGNMLQISMDGPATNFTFFREIVDDRHQTDVYMPKLLELGSCSLHIVHRAFSTGIQKTGWDLDRVLHSLFYRCDNAPARRNDYTTITKSHKFPLKFCATRWIEDMQVVERAIEV